jgi:hypothetical protein
MLSLRWLLAYGFAKFLGCGGGGAREGGCLPKLSRLAA